MMLTFLLRVGIVSCTDDCCYFGKLPVGKALDSRLTGGLIWFCRFLQRYPETDCAKPDERIPSYTICNNSSL